MHPPRQLAVEVDAELARLVPGVFSFSGDPDSWQLLWCASAPDLLRLLPVAYADAVAASYGEVVPDCLDLVIDGTTSPISVTDVHLDAVPLDVAAEMAGASEEGDALRSALLSAEPALVRPAVLQALRAVFASR